MSEPVAKTAKPAEAELTADERRAVSLFSKWLRDEKLEVSVFKGPVDTGLAVASLSALTLKSKFKLHVDKKNVPAHFCVIGTRDIEDAQTLRGAVVDLKTTLDFRR